MAVHKPKLLWVDLTVSVRRAELSIELSQVCEVQACPSPDRLDDLIRRGGFHGVCFDLDYPDQSSLDLLRRTKARYPSLPIILLTLQHSESLATWAFRTGVIDFLVKPVSRTEIHRCVKILNKVSKFAGKQSTRKLVENFAPIPSEIPVAVKDVDVALLPALYYVERNFRFKVRSEVVSKLCDMSPFRFSRYFREQYDITFQEYVVRYRVLEACRILSNPGMNVTDVAYAVGFNDASYFARTFKRYVGIAPSAYCVQFPTESARQAESDHMRSILGLPGAAAI